jgi:hypothetical protein
LGAYSATDENVVSMAAAAPTPWRIANYYAVPQGPADRTLWMARSAPQRFINPFVRQTAPGFPLPARTANPFVAQKTTASGREF